MQTMRGATKAGLFMGGVAIACRLLSLSKELLIAYLFGAGVVTDAYALVLLIPALGMALFIQGLRRYFLTVYPRLAADDKTAQEQLTNRFLTQLMVLALVGTTVASIVLRWTWPMIIASEQEVVKASYPLIFPAACMIIPVAAIAGLTAILNTHGKFSGPQVTAVIPTISILLAVAIGGRTWGAAGLLGGLLVGSVVQSLVLAVMVRRVGHRFDLFRDWSPPDDLWKFVVPLIVIDFIVEGNTVVDKLMASTLEPGKVAILSWAALLKDLLSSTLIASMLTVLLPFFSQQVARGSTDDLRRSCATAMRHAAIFLFPISALLCLVAPPLFRYFDIGQLDTAATRAMAFCLIAYGLALFADLVSTMLFQVLLVLNKLRVLLLLGFIASFLPNILFNLLLIGPYQELGLALSTSLVAYCTLVANYLIVRYCLGIESEKYTLGTIFGMLLATLVAAAVGFFLLKIPAEVWPEQTWTNLLGAMLASVGFVAVYMFLVLVFPGHQEAREAVKLIRGKLQSMAKQ